MNTELLNTALSEKVNNAKRAARDLAKNAPKIADKMRGSIAIFNDHVKQFFTEKGTKT